MYTEAQAKGDDKVKGSADRDTRRNAEGERSVKIPRDRCETLRAIIRQEDHAGDKAVAIKRVLDDLDDNNDPTRMIFGMAATLWNEAVEAKLLQTLWLLCKNRLPEGWQAIKEIDEGHLEGTGHCRQFCLELVELLNRHRERCRGCQGRKNARCVGCGLQRCRKCAHETGECRVCGQAWEWQQEASDNAHSEGKKGTNARKRAASTTSTANMHELGRNFVEEVLDVRETEASTAEEAAKGHHRSSV